MSTCKDCFYWQETPEEIRDGICEFVHTRIFVRIPVPGIESADGGVLYTTRDFGCVEFVDDKIAECPQQP